MAYPYGLQGAPAVGGGTPGLPSRSSSRGEVAFVIPGTYLWTVPDGVFLVCALANAGGGGSYVGPSFETSSGAGAATAYINNFPVTPGQQIVVRVGDAGSPGSASSTAATAGGMSFFADTATCAVSGGGAGASGVTAQGGAVISGTGWPGGNGAQLVGGSNASCASGGTAGGYSGPGATGVATTTATVAGNSGTGGSAASGSVSANGANGSGGLGLFGEGQSGSASGQGGSGGQPGKNLQVNFSTSAQSGLFGAGGSASASAASSTQPGTPGFVRIIWGADRAFPSSDVGPS